jgi:hypothetical protein
MYEYCENFFQLNSDIALEKFTTTQKDKSKLGQQYDVEQLMECNRSYLRHRRQIENFTG